MLAAASFLFILLVSLIIVRVASVALRITGMSRETAKFQARSAWTGTGFTTTESEQVVRHPTRRKIVTWLMILRGAGLVTAVSALLLSLSGQQTGPETVRRVGIIIAGLAVVWLISLSAKVDHWMTNIIARVIHATTDLQVRDYASILQLAGEYGVSELHVEEGDWMAGRTLRELDLPDEGILVLGVEKTGGTFIGAPRGRTRLEPGDNVILYGRSSVLSDIDQRTVSPEGSAGHYRSAREQKRIEEEEARAAEKVADSAEAAASAQPHDESTTP